MKAKKRAHFFLPHQGRPFDPDAFDLAKTNLWLRKLKWPRVTEAQLRKVPMGRDGDRG